MSTVLISNYNNQLVIVSVLIAVLASYTAIDLAGRVAATHDRAQVIWLLSGAIAMGLGIWSMHFIGMLAFQLPIAVRYDFVTVLLSIVPAIFAAGLALFLVSRPTLGWWRLGGGSLLMGLGIASMHYIGMMAMHTSAMMHYEMPLVVLSVLIAIAVSGAGLGLVFRLREATAQQLWQKLLAALVMGAAIPTMHYTGMAAAGFMTLSDNELPIELQSPENAVPLAAAVMIGTLIVLSLTLLTAFFDRRLSAQIIYAEAIQESQKYLKSVLQGIQVGVLVIGEDAQVQLSNQAMLDLLHLSSDAELQQVWNRARAGEGLLANEAIAHSSLAFMQPVLQQIMAKQAVQNAIVQMPAISEQEPTVLQVNTMRLSSSKGSTNQMVCTFNNVTELKRTENQLKESELRFKNLAAQEELLNHVSTQIRRSLDLPTILKTTVQEVRRIFGTDRALIYQFDLHARGRVVFEDVLDPWPPTLGASVDDCFPLTYFQAHQDGKMQVINTVSEVELDPLYWQFLKQFQVQAHLSVPIILNERLWGLLMIQQCSHSRVWKDDDCCLLCRLAIQLGIAIQQSNWYVQAEQSAAQAQAQAQQLRESEAQLKQQAQALEQTLQELKHVQLQLIQQEKMSSLGQLVAGIAHEINNPVNFIHGNLTYMQEHADDLLGLVQLYRQHYPHAIADIQTRIKEIDLEFLQEDVTRILASMQVGTDRIRKIVLSLRNFSRIDESEFKAVDVHEGLDSALMILQHRLNDQPNQTTIEVIRDYSQLPLVECYPGQLNQVFMNLLVNAIDALEETKKRPLREHDAQLNQIGRIRIRTSMLDHQWIEIAIADNGLGMSASIQQQIFNPFFTTKSIGQGTGMGLSISYQIIVERHRGKLECFSNPHRGTEFIIQIPIQQVVP